MTDPLDDDAFDTANRLFFRIYQCANLVHKNGTRAVEHLGVTTQQWAVLGALARPKAAENGMTVKELIAFLQVSRQNLSQVLDRLEQRGFVERVRGLDDGRNRFVRMTGQGWSLWRQLRQPIAGFYADALRHLPAKRQLALIEALDLMRTGLIQQD